MDRYFGKRLAPFVWMLLGSACFAGMAFFAKDASRHFQWPTIAAARAGVAFVITLAWARWNKVPLVAFQPPSLWMRSLAGTASLLAGFYAISHSGGNGASGRLAEIVTILNMYPLWVVALSWPLMGVPARPALWLAIAVGIVGYGVIQAGDPSNGGSWKSLIHFDTTLAVAAFASLGSSFALIGLHKTKGVRPLAIVVHFSCVATVVGLFAAWWGEASGLIPRQAMPREIPPYLLLLVVGGCATLGQVCLTLAFTAGNPGPVSAVGLMQAVFTAVLEAAVYQRGFSIYSVAGMVLVMVPTAWVMLNARTQPEPDAT